MAEFPHTGKSYSPPKDYEGNLLWRRDVLRLAAEDPEFAAGLRRLCSEDCLFYINGFCWTFNPKDVSGVVRKLSNIPFITYPFQDEAIAEGLDAIRYGYDIAWPKSRTMGASWMGLTIFEWLWHFQDDLSFLLISRNQEYVDVSGNPKTLFWKIDFLHRFQPDWLRPNMVRRLKHIGNLDTESVIDAESTTGNAGRGDRRTAMFIDEHAAFDIRDGFNVLSASRDVTNCRLFNSTPMGSANAFYEVVHNSAVRVCRMHWTKHPIYSQGLYSSIESREKRGVFKLDLHDKGFRGKVKVLRKEWRRPKFLNFPEEYPFILDGKARSPWYDSECARCVSTQEIAQELDIDFLGSAYQYFDQEFIRLLIEAYCVPYILRGRVVYEPDSLEPYGFELDDHGPLFLWFNLAGDGPLLQDTSPLLGNKYGLGADISHGTGASNSCISVVDLVTGKKVALWKDPNTDPMAFAEEAIALAKWFNKGYLAWDASGPSGKTFTNVIIERHYENIYYRRNQYRIKQLFSDAPGMFLNPEERRVLFDNYRAKLQGKLFINPSKEGMLETLQFIVEPGGKVVHQKSVSTQDPTGAREAHGDEVVADAIACKLLSVSPVSIKAKEKEIPWMSPAWRLREESLQLAERSREDW